MSDSAVPPVLPAFDLRTFLLSRRGRLGRSSFFSYAALVGIGLITGAFALGMSPLPATFGFVVIFLTWCALLYPSFCVTSRRLHDIGLPSAWTLLFLPGLILDITPIILGVNSVAVWPVFAAFKIAVSLITFFFCLFLILKKGQPGPNRYGDTTA